jgi:hypothetical protein
MENCGCCCRTESREVLELGGVLVGLDQADGRVAFRLVVPEESNQKQNKKKGVPRSVVEKHMSGMCCKTGSFFSFFCSVYKGE